MPNRTGRLIEPEAQIDVSDHALASMSSDNISGTSGRVGPSDAGVHNYFVRTMSPSFDSHPVGDSTPLKSQVEAELERVEGPLTVAELTDRLLDRDDVVLGSRDDIDSWSSLHQHLYRDELQRLTRDDVVVFDPDTGLVAPIPPGRDTHEKMGATARSVADEDSVHEIERLSSTAAGSASELFERVSQLPLYYGGLLAVAVGGLWLYSVGSVVTVAVALACLVLGLAAGVLARHYRA